MTAVGPPAPSPVPIGPFRDARKLGEYALVLDAMRIGYVVEREDGGTSWLVVEDRDGARAIGALRAYEAENRDWPPRRAAERLPYPRSLVAPALMIALVVFFFVTGPASAGARWFGAGAASADRMLHGQIWRAVTALTLHADAVHVAGNALAGAVFLSAVNRRLGDGRGVFAVLCAGAIGNLANALLHRGAHLSVGASTAVFAAVGVLGATQLVVDRRTGTRKRVERVAPILGALALLGLIGSSPHADLWAHLLGLAAGVLAGLLAAPAVGTGRRSSPRVQALFGAAAAAIVTGAWAAAWKIG